MDIIEIKHYTKTNRSFLEVNHNYIGEIETGNIEIYRCTEVNIRTSARFKIYGAIEEIIFSDCVVRYYENDVNVQEYSPRWEDDYFVYCVKNLKKQKRT